MRKSAQAYQFIQTQFQNRDAIFDPSIAICGVSSVEVRGGTRHVISEVQQANIALCNSIGQFRSSLVLSSDQQSTSYRVFLMLCQAVYGTLCAKSIKHNVDLSVQELFGPYLTVRAAQDSNAVTPGFLLGEICGSHWESGNNSEE